MIVGTNKESKAQECRVALLPTGVQALVEHGHTILVERGAGAAAGWPDDAYQAAGATLVDDSATLFAEAELVYKVKEPMAAEFPLLRRDQILFTYIHSGGNRPLCDRLLASGVLGIAFEDVLSDGRLPLLEPMSVIAGYMGMVKGFELLQTLYGGPGLLPGGLPGVCPTRVAILGAGSVGQGAVRVAHGLGADVVVLDIDGDKLTATAREFPGVRTLQSNAATIAEVVAWADVLLNGVMWPRSRRGHLVTREMVQAMKPGAVIVDVSADVGGAIETCLRQTTLADPTYTEAGHVHYLGANIPSLAARSASEALSAVTLPYALALADKGAARALQDDASLRHGLTCIVGKFTRAATADWYGSEVMGESELDELLRGMS